MSIAFYKTLNGQPASLEEKIFVLESTWHLLTCFLIFVNPLNGLLHMPKSCSQSHDQWAKPKSIATFDYQNSPSCVFFIVVFPYLPRNLQTRALMACLFPSFFLPFQHVQPSLTASLREAQYFNLATGAHAVRAFPNSHLVGVSRHAFGGGSFGLGGLLGLKKREDISEMDHSIQTTHSSSLLCVHKNHMFGLCFQATPASWAAPKARFAGSKWPTGRECFGDDKTGHPTVWGCFTSKA